MVNKIVGWLVLVPLCAVLIAFALANRQLVSVNLNPFGSPADAAASGYGIPLFIILYVVLLVGVLLGGVASWFAQASHRRGEKHWRREAQHLTSEIEALRRGATPGIASPTGEIDDMLELR